ncbi:MAG: T9SS type A sorting domain-containing protein [Crocinitomicaceae bacterium]|nr:T9SS type A sorting domain-containing protein [Crocinitomicaceae bacterium]
MRKVYLLAFGLAITASAGAQQQKDIFNSDVEVKPFTEDRSGRNHVAHSNYDRASGDVFYTNECATTTTSDWTLTSPGGQGAWQNGTSLPASMTNYIGTIDSPTKTNGFYYFNSIQYLVANNCQTQEVIMTLANPIDCSTRPGVILSFWQYYRAFNADDCYVGVSIDGTNWTEWDVNSDVQSNSSAIAEYKEYNISDIAAGESQVWIRFRYYGDTSCGYGWEIDDINLTETYPNDLVHDKCWLANIYSNFEYTRIPADQAGMLTIMSPFRNMGANTVSNVVLDVNVKNSGGTSVYTGSGNTAQAGTAALGELDTIVFETTLDLSTLAVDDYTVEVVLKHSVTDDKLTNDTIIRNLAITDNIMGHYDDYQQYYYYTSPGYDTPPINFQFGQTYEIATNVDLQGIDFFVSPGPGSATQTTSDNEITVYVYTYDFQNDPVEIANRRFQVTSSMFDTWATFNFNQTSVGTSGPVSLSAGSVYVVSVECPDNTVLWGIGNAEDVDYSSLQYGDFYVSGPGWGSNSRDLALDLNFDISLSTGVELENNFSIGQNQPNPMNGNSIIRYTLGEASNVSVTFTDVQGKVISTMNQGTQNAGTYTLNIDGNDFAEGVYFYTFTVGEKQVTKRMVVTK